ncbi:glycoside hydrolase family 44 protein [Teredinibacter turnerae]|uniref:glycoside hydrolase family 44 protein n=1 Tax=Teredinibacter turnerae TaxID=2426 RepID=UPI000361AB25|nr:glycoside hydrolase family 44 protein [Teredinibacter turnerae]
MRIRLATLALCAALSPATFADNVTVQIDADGGKKLISRALYGMNNSNAESLSDADWQRFRDAGVRLLRENGGNNSTKYNWQLHLSSHPDWYNNVYAGNNNWDNRVALIQENLPGADTMWAFQLIGKVAATSAYNFNDWEFNQSQWWTGVAQNLAGGGEPNLDGGGEALVEGDPNLYLMDWSPDDTVGILDHWFGVNGLGVRRGKAKYWSMDNEPGIWAGTHDDVVKEQTPVEDFLHTYFETAKKARAKFPGIKITGPVPANEWQWYAWGGFSVPQEEGFMSWMEYFIKRVSEEQRASGVRLLDVLDLHYYPGAYNAEDIVQLHRTFFDRDFVSLDANGVKMVEGGWDDSINKEYIFGRVNDWLAEYMGPDHGVTLGLTEMCVRDVNPITTAIWYASMLGTFADNGVEIFTPWCWNTGMWETLHLFSRYNKPYRVASSSSLEEFVSAYSSINEAEDAMTVLLVNRSTSESHTATVAIDDFPLDGPYRTLRLHNLPAEETFVSHRDNALEKGNVRASDNTVTLELPPLSVTAVLLKARP